MNRRLRILLILTLMVPHHIFAKDDKITGSSASMMILGVATCAATGVAAFFVGKWFESNKDNVKIKRIELEAQAKLDAEKNMTQQFHGKKALIEFIHNFETYSTDKNPELLSAEQQEKLFHEILAVGNSIHGFQAQLKHHMAFYKTLAIKDADALKHESNRLHWLQRALNTNKQVKRQEQVEKEVSQTQARLHAEIKQIEGKCKLQKKCTQVLDQLSVHLDDLPKHISDQISSQLNMQFGILNSCLAKQNADQTEQRAAQAQEHKQLKQSLVELLTAMRANQATLEALAKLTAPKASAPREEEIYAARPPAYNPDYKPEYPPRA